MDLQLYSLCGTEDWVDIGCVFQQQPSPSIKYNEPHMSLNMETLIKNNSGVNMLTIAPAACVHRKISRCSCCPDSSVSCGAGRMLVIWSQRPVA